MNKWLIFLTLFISYGVRAQTVLYVDGNIASSGSGSSWASAYQTLNEALNAVNSSSTTTKFEIRIAEGTYFPAGVQTATNRDSTFFIGRGGVQLIGGFPRGGGSRNLSNYATVLSGDIGLPVSNLDNSRHVMVIAGAAGSDTVLLDGLFFTNGYATTGTSKLYNGVSIAAHDGAGMVIKKVTATVLINRCYFNDLLATQHAGAVYNEASTTVFTNCSFFRNSAGGSGGALFIQSDSNVAPVVLSNCDFKGNSGNFGGCIYNIRTAAPGPGTQILNCQFNNSTFLQSNYAYFGGGAIADIATRCQPADIRNSFFFRNSAWYGGAIFDSLTDIPAGAAPNIKACWFEQNQVNLFGGGVATVGANSNYWIDSCAFYVNRAVNNRGGGLFNSVAGAGSLVKVSRCQFNQDTARFGGGVFNAGAARFTGNRFLANGATNGGGMYNLMPDAPVYLEANQFRGNFAARSGGGLFNTSVVADTISNCLFAGNRAILSGGGLSDSTASPVIIHCTFGGDSASLGNAMQNDASSPSIHNSILWDGTGTISNVNGSAPVITYSTVQGGYAGMGNLASDPLFLTPGLRGTIFASSGDYSIIPCSPAMDAGLNAGAYTGLKDLAGNARLFGPAVDQGAYENVGGPFPPPITGTSAVCGTGSTFYQNAYIGGTWSVSNPTVATVSNNGKITYYAPGTDTIYYTVTTGSCTHIATKVLTVFPPPIAGPIIGQDSVCAGTMTSFKISVDSTTTYLISWSSDDGSIATPYNYMGDFICYKPGSVKIRCTVTTIIGCREVDSFDLTVLPSPAVGPIGGNNSYCLHDTITFYDTTAGGIWTSSDNSKAQIDSLTGFLQTIDTGSVTIRYTSVANNWGCLTTVTKSIVVDQVDASLAQLGFSLVASDSGAIYQWLDCRSGHQPIPGENGRSFTPLMNGQYAVIVSRGSCVDTSTCVGISGLGVSPAYFQLEVRVFPNPANDRVSIRTAGVIPDNITIVDAYGRKLKQFNPDRSQTDIRLHDLPAGYYLIEIRYGGRISRLPLSVVR